MLTLSLWAEVGDYGLLYSRNTDKMFIFNIYIYLTNNFKDNYISFYSQIDCSASSSVLDLRPEYRKSAGLRYPVNVGRNVARQSANTHFVFPSDVELYPTPGKRVFQCSFFTFIFFLTQYFFPSIVAQSREKKLITTHF